MSEKITDRQIKKMEYEYHENRDHDNKFHSEITRLSSTVDRTARLLDDLNKMSSGKFVVKAVRTDITTCTITTYSDLAIDDELKLLLQSVLGDYRDSQRRKLIATVKKMEN